MKLRVCAVCEGRLPNRSRAHVQYCPECGHPNPASGWEVRALTPKGTPRVEPRTLHVRALIDGTSELWFRPNSLVWVHVEGQRPGLPDSLDEPTWVNQCEWFPEWKRHVPTPTRVQKVAYSLPVVGDSVRLEVVEGRGRVKARLTSEAFVLRFEDPVAGAWWHEVLVRWSQTPRLTD